MVIILNRYKTIAFNEKIALSPLCDVNSDKLHHNIYFSNQMNNQSKIIARYVWNHWRNYGRKLKRIVHCIMLHGSYLQLFYKTWINYLFKQIQNLLTLSILFLIGILCSPGSYRFRLTSKRWMCSIPGAIPKFTLGGTASSWNVSPQSAAGIDMKIYTYKATVYTNYTIV